MKSFISIEVLDQKADLVTVEKRLIRPGRINWFSESNLVNIGITTGAKLRAWRLICPHMGSDLTTGKYDVRLKTIQCGWHGYIFSLETGDLVANPNIVSTKPARLKSEFFDPDVCPKLRLHELKITEQDTIATIYLRQRIA